MGNGRLGRPGPYAVRIVNITSAAPAAARRRPMAASTASVGISCRPIVPAGCAVVVIVFFSHLHDCIIYLFFPCVRAAGVGADGAMDLSEEGS